MSNNGPRFQARYSYPHGCMVVDTSRRDSLSNEHLVTCLCEDIAAAKIIARALNRELMQQ